MLSEYFEGLVLKTPAKKSYGWHTTENYWWFHSEIHNLGTGSKGFPKELFLDGDIPVGPKEMVAWNE